MSNEGNSLGYADDLLQRRNLQPSSEYNLL